MYANHANHANPIITLLPLLLVMMARPFAAVSKPTLQAWATSPLERFRRWSRSLRDSLAGIAASRAWSRGCALLASEYGAVAPWQVLHQQAADLDAEGKAITATFEAALKTDAKSRLTDEQKARLEAIDSDVSAMMAEIKLLRAQEARDLGQAAVPDLAALTDAQREALETAAEKKAKDAANAPTPFKTFGHQLAAVARATQNPHAPADPGLLEIHAAAAGASEGVSSDGGFLVQTDFTAELLKLVHETGVLAGRTDRKPISGMANGIKINAIDETSRVDGSRQGGIQAYWTAEAAALTATKPKYRQMELTLQKLTGLYYATDELLADTVALGAFASDAFAEEFGFKLDDAIIRGAGGGMPLGILGHAGTVSVAKESAQVAATIVKENIEKMYSRMWARSIANAEWFINQDCWPQLFALSQIVGIGGVPVFLPPGGSLANAPNGTLLGRPVMPIEQCETLGTVGDIMLADFSQYLMIEKGGIDAASSIHVQFLTDETVFRFILRTDGQPKRNAPLTPFKGTATQSSFITLATRA